MSRLGKLANGLILTALVAGLVVAGAGALPVVLSPVDQSSEQTTYEEFEPETIVSEPLASTGTITPDKSLTDTTGEVLIDTSASNRFGRTDIQPMVTAFNEVGYETTLDAESDFEEKLTTADALVIIDPGSAYSEDQLDEIESFLNNGGRVVVLGEPNRVSVSVGLFGSSLQETQSDLTSFESKFGLQFNTEYVYDQSNNDGNYRRPIVSPHDDASLSPADTLGDAEDIVLYTPTEVQSTNGAEPILVTSPSAKQSGTDRTESRTVAVRDENLLAVGDSSFIGAERHNVGDNDIFLAAVVEFLVSGDRTLDVPTVDESDGDSADAPANETDENSGDAAAVGSVRIQSY